MAHWSAVQCIYIWDIIVVRLTCILSLFIFGYKDFMALELFEMYQSYKL